MFNRLAIVVILCVILAQSSASAQGPREAVSAPADFRSRHFLLHTDLPPDDARALLDRMEDILALISKYWGQPLAGTLECYVVRHLDAWPAGTLSPVGRAKIAADSGITTTETLNRGRQFISGRSTVFAKADGGTPEHEIVHAYCGQTFGRTGPLWYSEGMAELGQFWQAGDGAVQVKQHIVDYLRSAPPWSVREIVADNAADGNTRGAARTGDSWQAYARRWSLCHLLVHNDNYAPKFRALGLGYLSGASPRFEEAFGSQLDELEFEYRLLVENLEQGYRADLCRWDWKRRSRRANHVPTSAKVFAKRGWQPSGAIVRSGKLYHYTTRGSWRVDDAGEALTANGDAASRGRLEGAIFHDYQLGKPFLLGAEGTFSPPADGKLMLRCREDWGALSDNSGLVTVKIRQASADSPLPGPADAARAGRPGPAGARQ